MQHRKKKGKKKVGAVRKEGREGSVHLFRKKAPSLPYPKKKRTEKVPLKFPQLAQRKQGPRYQNRKGLGGNQKKKKGGKKNYGPPLPGIGEESSAQEKGMKNTRKPSPKGGKRTPVSAPFKNCIRILQRRKTFPKKE